MNTSTDTYVETLIALIQQWQEVSVDKKLPREAFGVLHSAADYLRSTRRVNEAVELLKIEKEMGVDRFLGHRLEHARQIILSFFEAEKKEEGMKLIDYYTQRPYLFDDFGKLGFFLFVQATQSLREKNGKMLAHCLRLLARTEAGMRDNYLIRLVHFAGGTRKLLAHSDALDMCTQIVVRMFWTIRLLSSKGFLAAIFGRGLQTSLRAFRILGNIKGKSQYWMLSERGTPSPLPESKRPILVTRAMGGIGDILMMTPGLRALRHTYPDREIHFAVPVAFHALLENNPDIVVKDIETLFYREDYFAFYNLTECPASRIESTTLPHVEQNRIDIFSQAMGIAEKEQSTVGRTPVYNVTDAERAWAKAFFAERGLAPEECIAVQPYAADAYKNYPHMETLVARMAHSHPILLFHGAGLSGFECPNVVKVDHCSLRHSIAIFSLCKELLAVDSAFVHIAGALNIKTIALFGPTDGNIFTKYYPKCQVKHGYKVAACASCWRNQEIVCSRTLTGQGGCMQNIFQNY